MNEYRVFGPPGTGKTTYLTRQIQGAVDTHGPEGVCVASFTRAAAAELVSRELPLARERVGTLHAFCFNALGRPKIAEANTDEWNELFPAWAVGKSKVAAEDIAASEQCGESAGEPLLQAVNGFRARLVPIENWPSQVAEFYSEWCRWKRRNFYRDFTDLIEETLAQGREMPGAPKVGFFDEVQDFTALELSLVRSWAKHMETCVLAGDDDQCIYAFKGATPDAFLNPPVPPTHKRVLDRSWRLPSEIVRVSAQWIEQLKNREPKPFAPHRQGGSVSLIPSTLGSPCNTFEALVAEAMTGGQSLMLLATCTYMTNQLVKSLKLCGALYHNPFRRVNGMWNPYTPGKGRSTLQKIVSLLSPTGARVGGNDYWTLTELDAFASLLSATRCLERGGGKAFKAIDPAHVMNDLHDAEEGYRLADKWFKPEVLAALFEVVATHDILGLSPFVEAKALQAVEDAAHAYSLWGDTILEAAKTQPRIIVGTIHSVKGGEADNVILYPDISPKQAREMMMNPDSRDALTRTMYVGMTRARENLFLAWPDSSLSVSWDVLDM